MGNPRAIVVEPGGPGAVGDFAIQLAKLGGAQQLIDCCYVGKAVLHVV